MPEVRFHLEGDAPDKPHLALLNSEEGNWTAMPPGAVIAVIEDPSRGDKIFPMVIAKVTLKKLTLRCLCGDPNCSVHYEYSLAKRGHHTPVKRTTAVSSDSQGPTVLNAPLPKKVSR